MKVINFTSQISSWVSCLVVIGWCAVTAPTVRAQELVFSDDFSQGFTQWQLTRKNNGNWSIQDGQAEANVTSYSTIVEMVPKDEFWNAAWKNIEYQLDYTPLEGVDKNISFNFENLQNWYEIHFLDDWYNLVRLTNGQTPFSISKPFTMVNGRTYHLAIRFENGRIRVWVDDQLVGDEFDNSFTQNYGKVGIKAGTGSVAPTRVRFDNIKVYLLDTPLDTALAVPLLMQTDPLWAAQTYDHATNWSDNPTIERWGCALTSMVMVLRYYGIGQLPDGQVLTPASLNQWLLTQADGYLGTGLLNWQAVTRLTRLVSSSLSTPKLEFSFQATDWLAAAKADILAAKPVIVNLPGHFVVGSGLLADQSDILIKDPAYTLKKLSQHTQSPLSIRRFQPSQTDLSYLVIVHDPATQVQLTDANGTVVAGLSTHIEYVTERAQPTKTSTPLAVSQLAKPATGTYRLRLTGATQPVEVYVYNQQADVQQWSISVADQAAAPSWQLSYSKEGSSNWQLIAPPTPQPSPLPSPSVTPSPRPTPPPVNNWHQLRQLLKTQYHQRAIRPYGLYLRWLWWVELIERTKPNKQRWLLQAFRTDIRLHRRQLSARTYRVLTETINALLIPKREH